jgi:glycosyltransferase involved in cell wall biosynthesis
MAHLFKKPKQTSNGIIIFTHKEWGFFSGNKIVRKLKREGKLPEKLFNELRSPYLQIVRKLSQNYFIGIHFGFYYPHPVDSDIATFIFSKSSNTPNISDNLLRIPFNSRDFTPRAFARTGAQKNWDVMTVARDVKFKNFPLLFESILKCLEARPETTFLLIVPSQSGVKFGVEKGLEKLFYASFNSKQQEQITFLYLHPGLEWGLGQNQLVDFYNRSRLFTLFSSREGESRVISEALCCGLPVVTYTHLLGGGSDLLNEKNSISFDHYDRAEQAWIETLNRFPNGCEDEPEKLTREDYTLASLHDYFDRLFNHHQQHYDGALENCDQLDRRLPGHYYDVPWRLNPKRPTADILSKKQLGAFLQYLKDN